MFSNELVFRFPAVPATAARRLAVTAQPLAGGLATFVQVRTATLTWAPFNAGSDEAGAAAVGSARG